MPKLRSLSRSQFRPRGPLKLFNHIFLEGTRVASNYIQFELNQAVGRFQGFWETSFWLFQTGSNYMYCPWLNLEIALFTWSYFALYESHRQYSYRYRKSIVHVPMWLIWFIWITLYISFKILWWCQLFAGTTVAWLWRYKADALKYPTTGTHLLNRPNNTANCNLHAVAKLSSWVSNTNEL